MSKQVRTFCFLVSMALAGAGCGEPKAELRVSGRPIVGGEPDTDPAHMATVALTFGDAARFFCSGTLITETVVLTAGHCVDAVDDISSIKVFFGDSVWSPGDYRNAVDGLVHPRYNPGALVNDIALLQLESPAPAGITPIPHLPAALGLSQADEGTTLVDFSGFGVDEVGTSGVKLHAEDFIDVVCDGPGICAGYVNPLTFGYDQRPGGPCFGDSGGPAYILRDNVEYVAGTTSYGDGRCDRYGASTTVDRFAEWIDANIIPEDCQNAQDDDFDGLTDCGDSECFGDPACPEDCTNGVDDEPDGDTDCDDADCALHPQCLPDACEDAATVSCGEVIGGDTHLGKHRFEQYGCLLSGSEEGPELGFRLSAPAGTPVTVVLNHGPGSDLDLFLLPPAGASCDTGTCLDSSQEWEPPERVDFIMPANGAILVVETYERPTTFEISMECGNPVELCADGADNDEDGDTDCDDADCNYDYVCLGPANLSVDPLQLDITASLDAGDPSPELTLHNAGGLTAIFQVTGSQPWIGAAPAEGTLKPVSSRVIQVRMDIAGMDQGVHTGSLQIAAAGAVNSPVTVPIRLELVPDRPVPPVTGLQIEPRDQALRLTWTTPQDPIVHRVILRRSPGVPPALPNIGEPVYTGLGEELLDTGLQNGATYCYSAFAADASNRYADPATACAIPGENRPPPVPEPLSPSDGAALTGVPVLVASAVADPEGDQVTYTFQLLDQSGSTVLETGAGDVSQNRVDWTPAFDLQPETIYRWQVEAQDSHEARSGFSTPRSFSLRFPHQDAGVDGGPPPKEPDSGCGCGTTPSHSTVAAIPLLLAIVLVCLRRRRKRRLSHLSQD
jgi:uncharacterized protein (TIGR03382 family)